MIGAPYRVVRVDMHAPDYPTPEYLAINPLGQIPTLVIPDGQTVTESAAMMLAIAERHPESGMMPAVSAPERPDFLRWMVFLAVNVYPAVRRIYYPQDAVEDEASYDDVRRRAMAELRRDWGVMEAALDPAPYLLGAGPTALDLYVAMLSRWAVDQHWFREACPKLAAARDRIESHPKVSAVWRESFSGSDTDPADG